ncbi:YggT family protein [Corynebacterium ulceribovis]|uniref:YggT family protein n=1 Tax=Corynebacterium ulceribovis TaxID=487732 RepID=UPI00036DE471|nr:YggT family protein [Corynebacterium ulceribovis]
MASFFAILYFLVRLYVLLLLVRIVMEMIQSFGRRPRPGRIYSIVGEFVFRLTDPPVRALRKLIPPLQLGGIALDLSVIVLFLILAVLQIVLRLQVAAFS